MIPKWMKFGKMREASLHRMMETLKKNQWSDNAVRAFVDVHYTAQITHRNKLRQLDELVLISDNLAEDRVNPLEVSLFFVRLGAFVIELTASHERNLAEHLKISAKIKNGSAKLNEMNLSTQQGFEERLEILHRAQGKFSQNELYTLLYLRDTNAHFELSGYRYTIPLGSNQVLTTRRILDRELDKAAFMDCVHNVFAQYTLENQIRIDHIAQEFARRTLPDVLDYLAILRPHPEA